ncbi:MAG: recombinase family protein [Conexibacter sp.]
MKKAVILLRVSSSGQLTDSAPDGLSISAQRTACTDKAGELGAEVVREYVAPAERASVGVPPTVRELLADLARDRDIDFVVLHKLDRLARDELSDFQAYAEIRAAGAQLVSVSESIDDTPSGMLVHGILASINAFHSRNLKTEVLKGTTEKAKLGGTPFRAPVGYLNVRKVVDGREIRTIAVDPERAPLVQWAFAAYASGNYTLDTLLDALTAKGLTTRPGPKMPAKPITRAYLSMMLQNPYYVGTVVYRGVAYQGRHEPLIPRRLFERVEAVFAAHRSAGEKDRKHGHYLKGTLYCARCGSRMSLANARGNGGTYRYFFCIGRHVRRTVCDQPYLRVEAVELAVTRYYAQVRLSDDEHRQVEAFLAESIGPLERQRKQAADRARRRLAALTGQRDKLLHAHYAGAVPLDQLKREQDRIARELAAAEDTIASAQGEFAKVQQGLDAALRLARDVEGIYLRADAHTRRQCNQAFFCKLFAREDEDGGAIIVDAEFSELYRDLLGRELLDSLTTAPPEPNAEPAKASHGVGSKEAVVVGAAGFEPATSRV